MENKHLHTLLKIYYLSSAAFTQVDREVIGHLSQDNDVIYSTIILQSGSNFTDREIQDFSSKYKVLYTAYHLKYRQRDIRSFKTFFRLMMDIRKSKPDLIYIAAFDHPIFSVLSVFLDRDITIVGLHDVEYHSNIPNAIFHKIARKITLFKFVHYQVFSQGQAALYKTKHKFKSLHVIPLTLSDYGSHSVVREYATLKLLFFGNISSYKGLDILIAAVNKLSDKYPNFELTIAGNCKDWAAEYEPLIKTNGRIIQKIRFIKNEEVPVLFSNCHYLILPYRDATQSGPLMIAYNYNIPVIASDIDGFKEFIIDGKTGYLFENEQENSLVTVLESIINKPLEEYEALTAAMKEHVEANYSKHTIIKKYNQMFNDILKIS